MKKRISLLIAALLILLLIPVSSYAYQNGLPKVADYSGIFTDSQISSLQSQVEKVSNEYECDVLIVAVPSTYGQDIVEYTDDLYDQNKYGYGDTEDGVILLIATDDRQVYISTAGTAMDMITDYGINNILDEIVPSMQSNDYYSAAQKFISCCKDYFKEYETSGYAYDTNNVRRSDFSPFSILIDAGLGLLMAGLPLRKKKKEMQTVQAKANASDYILANSFRLNYRNDVFVNRSVTRTPIPKSPPPNTLRGGPGGGGGSTIHMSSGGHMHGGGGRHF